VAKYLVLTGPRLKEPDRPVSLWEIPSDAAKDAAQRVTRQTSVMIELWAEADVKKAGYKVGVFPYER